MIFLLLFHQKQLILINYNKQNLYIICYYLYLQIY